jgi:hypothetical protein
MKNNIILFKNKQNERNNVIYNNMEIIIRI